MATDARAALAGTEHELFGPAIVDPSIQCAHCFGVKGSTYAMCAGCTRVNVAPFFRASSWFGLMVPDTGGFYGAMVQYKSLGGERGRQQQTKLAAVLALSYTYYREQIVAALGGTPTMVTPVPSSRGKSFDEQPLRWVVDRVLSLRPALMPSVHFVAGAARAPHTFEPECFAVSDSVTKGARVLLIEDLTVSGATAYSAWYALRARGAHVAILSIGRQLKLGFGEAPRVLQGLTRPAWL